MSHLTNAAGEINADRPLYDSAEEVRTFGNCPKCKKLLKAGHNTPYLDRPVPCDCGVLETSGYHGHPKFYKLLQEMADLHSRKNHDYSGDDPLSNLRASEEIGIPAWKSILVRLMDKWGRLKTFAKTGSFEVKEESVKDTLMDNAVYSLLCIIVLEEKEIGRPFACEPDIPVRKAVR